MISKEVQQLFVDRHIFEEVQAIIRASPRLHQPSSFYTWMARTYTAAAVMGVRRQVKVHKDSIALARLPAEIIATPRIDPL